MFDGAILDVAIGMILLFLVASLVASAIVEAIGGLLHRRSKHLWDTLDLLLGNTSTMEGDVQSIVREIYTQPFITGLVRPTDRLRFDPVQGDGSRAPRRPDKLPLRARQSKNMQHLPMAASGAVDEGALRRRFYGPNNIHAREFTKALLSVVRPDGILDTVHTAIAAIEAAMPDDSVTDVAVDGIAESIEQLQSAADALGSSDFSAAIGKITAAGASISAADLAAAVSEARAAAAALLTGAPTSAEFAKAIEVLPKDLRTKLLAVAGEAVDEVGGVRTAIEDWYDRNMAAASSWYRKQTRWFLFLAGLAMAASMNIDAVHATSTLYRDESLRDGLVAVAEQVSDLECPAPAADGPPVTADTDPETAAAPAEIDLACFRAKLGGSLAFPVGWSGIDTSPGGWLLRGLGWLFVAAAVTLGAPFWFDLLGRALARKTPKPAS